MDLRGLARALGLFAVLEPTHLYAHHIQVFLVVANDGPCTIAHVAETLNLSGSAISRTVMALGHTTRKGGQGFDLIEAISDPLEGRRFLLRLTGKGQAMKRQLSNL